MATRSIDTLITQKSHLDLSNGSLPTDFGFDDYSLSTLLDDIVLVEYTDVETGEGGEYVLRGGIAVPTNQATNMWRKGEVILVGPSATQVNVGDTVLIPNNMGIPVSNFVVTDHGRVNKGLFINEQRIFGICKANKKDA